MAIDIQNPLILSVITASVAFTLTETKLFKGFRQWLADKNNFLGKLFSCGYCLGHWVAFGLVAVYRPRLLVSWAPLDYLLTVLVIAWLGGLQWVVMCWLMQETGK